ncbi:MAG: isocitrate/isopropylmalate dehydrogenase family protein [Gemmatimonadota bacterium]|nr:isocitrate/isopropylmalate dehydrogenase family protein [Gemmatimonadota bacterium]
MPRVALIPGDGIGKEVIREARRVLESVPVSAGFDLVEWDLGADRFLRDGVTITDDEFRTLSDEYDAILLGALGDPRVPGNEHARDILLGLRFRLDLFVNFRPCTLLSPEFSPLKSVAGKVDLEIFRENTEGVYTGMGGVLRQGTPDEVAIEEDVNTYRGVERIIRAAFEYAERRSRPKVTLVDKANAMRWAGGLWRRVFAEVSAGYPAIATDMMYVDAMAMDLVRRPEHYSVIVTSNLFGDIVSDLAAELTGGLGTAPSANLHPGRHALFEPVHGSAPDIAGRGKANPMGAIRCVALLLDHFGETDAAGSVESAVHAALEEGWSTPDLGGGRTTEEVGEWIARRVAGGAGSAG